MTESVFSPALQTLMEEFSRSGVRELHVRSGDFELYLSSDPATGRAVAGVSTAPTQRLPQSAPPQAPKPASPTHAAPTKVKSDALPADAVIVRAPNLGTFYRAPKPGAANYVEVGSVISTGDEVCLIEVMKLFTAVRSDAGGKVHAILAADGSMVEAGQPLFALVRD